MAVLKKGAKGRDVEALQKALNKLGARPALDIDGDFGPKTEEAVRKFQKKAALKPDGQVGEMTQAAISFGGKLPEMTVMEYDSYMTAFLRIKALNAEDIASYVKIDAEIAKLSDTLAALAKRRDTLFKEAKSFWAEWERLGNAIIAKQTEFEKTLTKNPKAAERLVQDCVKLDKKFGKVLDGPAQKNIEKRRALSKGVRDALSTTTRVVNEHLAAIEKRKNG